jgi:hypothetical protein
VRTVLSIAAIAFVVAFAYFAGVKVNWPAAPVEPPPPALDESGLSGVLAELRKAHPDAEIELRFEDMSFTDGGRLTESHEGATVGTGLKTGSDEAAQSFQAHPASLLLPGGVSINSSGVRIENTLISAAVNPFFILAGAFVIAAVVLAYLKRGRMATWAAIGAGACVAIAVTVEEFAFLWAWMLVAAVAVGLLWLWSEWKRGQAEREAAAEKRTLSAVTNTIENAPPAVAGEIKSRMKGITETDPEIADRIELAMARTNRVGA